MGYSGGVLEDVNQMDELDIVRYISYFILILGVREFLYQLGKED